jgi:hypothetical protein
LHQDVREWIAMRGKKPINISYIIAVTKTIRLIFTLGDLKKKTIKGAQA